jgi:hypothetical protein
LEFCIKSNFKSAWKFYEKPYVVTYCVNFCSKVTGAVKLGAIGGKTNWSLVLIKAAKIGHSVLLYPYVPIILGHP